MHGVHADLGEEPVLVVEQVADVAVGAEADHGPQFPVADAGADQGGEFLREGVGERGADLVAHAGGDGELEVPAASAPPVRRRRVTEDAARRWSAVS